MDKKIISVFAGLGLVCAQLPSWAQEKANYQLNEVVVTASKSPRKQSEIGKVVRVISGTTIYNEAGQVLVQMPYRDNLAWFFHGMHVMHGRHHDVPEGITRFTLQIWYC